MNVETGDLGMTRDIAKLLGVTPQTVSNWIGRRGEIGFPEPVVRLGNGNYPVFSLAAVELWHDQYLAEKPSRANRRMQRARDGRRLRRAAAAAAV